MLHMVMKLFYLVLIMWNIFALGANVLLGQETIVPLLPSALSLVAPHSMCSSATVDIYMYLCSVP